MTLHNCGPKMLATFYPFLEKSKSKQFTMKSTFLISLKISVSGSTDQYAHMATTCRSFGAMTPFDRHELSNLPQSLPPPFVPSPEDQEPVDISTPVLLSFSCSSTSAVGFCRHLNLCHKVWRWALGSISFKLFHFHSRGFHFQ